MNQHLLNPFAQDYPDSVDAAIETTAQRCRFNKTRGTWAGHLIATGCSDGLVEVVDLDTKDVIRNFDGHVRGVESLRYVPPPAWSRNGRYLLSASKDWKCVVWDLFYTDQNMPTPPHKPSPATSSPPYKRQRTRSTSDTNCASAEHPSTSSRGYPTSPMRDSIMFDTPLINAEFHPETSKIILATTSTHEVAVVYLSSPVGLTANPQPPAALSGKSSRRRIYWLRDQTRDEARASLVPTEITETRDVSPDTKTDGSPMDQDVPPLPNGSGSTLTDSEIEEKLKEAPGDAAPPPSPLSRTFTFATFHPSGEWIYAGTSQGLLLVFDARTRWLVNRTRISTTALKQIAFDRSGRYVVINSTDRAVRVMFVEHQEVTATQHASSPLNPTSELTRNLSRSEVLIIPLHKFQDQVSRTPWNTVGFSGDAEYVMGASATSAGTVNVWQTAVIDNWSAFAPGFEELEENREYEEKEDEFDIEDEDELSRRKRAEEEQDIETLPSSKKAISGITWKAAGNGNTGVSSVSNATAQSKNGSPGFWQLNWPDDDDDVDFFPHLDLSEPILAAEEEDVTRL
ncbi:hypothetical protein QFC22_000667 [Naganishia vaughanmartiniae]|uniref:Uncharacterized protein n=1 Tax=Naganishia vaughanmartiniae TaxID=1424756 RepID=A0ACC2XIL3_9TREE|nr:hypothetical protein QFC22_000667 [Naganishia vaughanmartiniae]